MADDETEPSERALLGVTKETELAFVHGLISIAPLLSAIAASAGGAKHIRELLVKEQEPLVIVVDDSFQKGQVHIVDLRVGNQSPHSIYLEAAALKSPVASNLLDFEIYPSNTWKSENVAGPRLFLPYRLLPERIIVFRLRLSLFEERDFAKESHGVLSLTYSKLDEKSAEVKDIQFRLRRLHDA